MSKQSSKPTPRVLLVDDHAIWRGGVVSMLEDSEFEVVGEAASGPEGVDAAFKLNPAVVLMDIRMAGGDGLDALAAIKAQRPEIAVIMMSAYENPTFKARALANGAAGYLAKGSSRDELLDAMRAVIDGQCLLSRADVGRASENDEGAGHGGEELSQPLSPREVEVLRMLATGLPNRDIGRVLFISESTVKTHVEHIISKLGVADRVQAAVWAARNGLA